MQVQKQYNFLPRMWIGGWLLTDQTQEDPILNINRKSLESTRFTMHSLPVLILTGTVWELKEVLKNEDWLKAF
jgi:hypothetical protein